MATDDFVAVIDGSTSKTATRIMPGVTNGRLCMQLISQYIRHADSGLTCKGFCDGVTASVRSHYDESLLSRLECHPEERMTASCIVYSRHRHEVWMIGDCQCMVDGTAYENPKPDEAAIAGKRAAIAQGMLDNGVATVDGLRGNDLARQAIIGELIESMGNQNKTYAVVDGFSIPASKVRIIRIPRTAREIVLASDGYPHLKPTLDASEEALENNLPPTRLTSGCLRLPRDGWPATTLLTTAPTSGSIHKREQAVGANNGCMHPG